MPIYEYECNACGLRFERKQSFTDEPINVCPECDTDGVRRLVQPVGVIFKGSGFCTIDDRHRPEEDFGCESCEE